MAGNIKTRRAYRLISELKATVHVPIHCILMIRVEMVFSLNAWSWVKARVDIVDCSDECKLSGVLVNLV